MPQGKGNDWLLCGGLIPVSIPEDTGFLLRGWCMHIRKVQVITEK